MNRMLSIFAAFFFAVTTAVAAPVTTWGQSPHAGNGGESPCYLPNYSGPLPCETTRPVEIVRQGLATMRQFKGRGGGFVSPAGMRFLDKYIAPHFDFAFMADVALRVGTHYVSGTDRARAMTLLRQDFLGRFASHLSAFDTSRLEVGPVIPGPRGEAVVPMRVWRSDGQPYGVDFHFHYAYGDWRIYNVMAGGHSTLIYYRSALPHMLWQ